ncbi:hypothetical protein I549_3206 [Mycobacterium avium subsp. avium 2285 (R)]|nr:hypothetical protein I549_3206 [Mycobacterium avium subsp. avium 2285 (R)]
MPAPPAADPARRGAPPTARRAAGRRYRRGWRPSSWPRHPPRAEHPGPRHRRRGGAAPGGRGRAAGRGPRGGVAPRPAARARSSRIAAIREAVGIAAYHCGDWAQALAELRAARRMGSKSALLALIADCERGLGRPERAIELARGPEAAELSGDDADELRIVAAGAAPTSASWSRR